MEQQENSQGISLGVFTILIPEYPAVLTLWKPPIILAKYSFFFTGEESTHYTEYGLLSCTLNFSGVNMSNFTDAVEMVKVALIGGLKLESNVIGSKHPGITPRDREKLFYDYLSAKSQESPTHLGKVLGVGAGIGGGLGALAGWTGGSGLRGGWEKNPKVRAILAGATALLGAGAGAGLGASARHDDKKEIAFAGDLLKNPMAKKKALIRMMANQSWLTTPLQARAIADSDSFGVQRANEQYLDKLKKQQARRNSK